MFIPEKMPCGKGLCECGIPIMSSPWDHPDWC